ncbi:hypothetical protein E4U41_004252 [Claviceps citrina]|nr:hypothetical protein E4U41_004252 [Claviceps citrina]
MPHSTSPCRVVDSDRLTAIGFGGSAIVYGMDATTVLKEYFDPTDDEITIERSALSRLSPHCNIVQCLGETPARSLILERGRPLLTNLNEANLDQKLRWIADAAEGLRHMHHNGIVHADFGCSNMVLIKDSVKIIDFGGCSIDGNEALAGYNWYNCQATTRPDLTSDIFAFGCAAFEILTGKPPYHEFETRPDRHVFVRNLYAQGRFPELKQMPLRETILGCWHGTFSCMDEIVPLLDMARFSHEEIDGRSLIRPLAAEID